MRALMLGLLAGCDLVFPAHDPGTTPPGDGLADAIVDPPPLRFVPTNRDFDGDGAMDDVDPCPLDPNITTGAIDTDNDGIGDGCDPDLNAGMPDCILLLDYFTMDNFNSGFQWVTDPDTTGWFVSDCDAGKFAYCAPARGGTSTLRFGTPLPLARLEAEVRIKPRVPTTPAKLQVFSGLDPDRDDGRACVLQNLTTTNLIELAIEDVTGGVPTRKDQTDTAVPYLDTQDLEIRWTPQGDDTAAGRTCTLPLADEHVDAPPAPPRAGAFVAIRETDSEVRLHYVIGYGSTCPM